MRKSILATCQLNQWVLDWEGNRERIVDAILQAKGAGAKLILTPELSIPGYGLLDHWLEGDVYVHSWEIVASIIGRKDLDGIIVDLGIPVQHRGCTYNARVICLDGQVLAVRPKLDLCNDGNFREMRYFTPWPRGRVDDYVLPECIQKLSGQSKCRVGEVVFETLDASFASETCEELWTPDSPHIAYSLAGIDCVLNSSGSHHELRKLHTRVELIKEATKLGGVYLYSNQKGCDGDRLYYDGCSMILSNGEMLAQGSQFSLDDVEVQTAVVDFTEVEAMRTSRSRGMQAQGSQIHNLERIRVNFRLCDQGNFWNPPKLTERKEIWYHQPEEEIALGPAVWCWDYLRRSRAGGFLVPLSGGIDSCATATIIFSMARLVVQALQDGNRQVYEDASRLYGEDFDPANITPQQFCNKVFTTVFMGMQQQSSQETRGRAKNLAEAIGSYHVDTNIDPMVSALTTVVEGILDFRPRFKVHGGTESENLALQNFQSRSRMVLAYALGQLIPTSRGRSGGLLILGSANVDECLRGYLTKYDCSSADINPIGGISKTDLKRFIAWAETSFALPILRSFLDATPTAELEPITDSYVQSDEADMGFTYDELSVLGRCRKTMKMGTVSMFTHLVTVWSHMDSTKVYKKVRDFMYYYAVNRHKMTTMTPGLYLETYTPDDNRYDLRPFLYPRFNYEHKKIETILKTMEEGHAVNGQS